MQKPLLEVKEARLRYLVSKFDHWERYLAQETNEIPSLTPQECLEEIISLKNSMSKRCSAVKKDRVTDKEVENARKFPVDRLIQFHRHKACCFVHQEKTPSLNFNPKRNRAHCYGCGANMDSIEILMKRDGMTFIDAVRELNQRSI